MEHPPLCAGVSVEWHIDGLTFRRCHPEPHHLFPVIWWRDHPDRNGHYTFRCPGEILLKLPELRSQHELARNAD